MNAIRNTTALLPFVMVLLAGAAAAVEPHQVRVSYAGLNLVSPAGSAELDRRINAAVNRVCIEDQYDLSDMSSLRRCRSEALARARIEQQRVVAEAKQLQGRQVLASR